MASWIASDVKQRLALIKQESTQTQLQPQTIAVFAPKWSHFNAIQHYFETLGIISQHYNESEQVTPINSFIGQALFNHLSAKRLDIIEGNVAEFLEQ